MTNETLAVDAVVENAGGEAGAYNVTLAVNETVVAANRARSNRGNGRVEVTHAFARSRSNAFSSTATPSQNVVPALGRRQCD